MFRVRGRHRRQLLVKADERDRARWTRCARRSRSARRIARRSAEWRSASTSTRSEPRRLAAMSEISLTEDERDPRRPERRRARRARATSALGARAEEPLGAGRRRSRRSVKFGDPVLKSRASEITDFGPELAREASGWSRSCATGSGVGPRGHPARRPAPAARLPGRRRTRPRPRSSTREIEWLSDELVVAEEGCLSMPRVSVDVERPLFAGSRRRHRAASRSRSRRRSRGAGAPARDRPPRRRADPRPHDRATSGGRRCGRCGRAAATAPEARRSPGEEATARAPATAEA